MLVICNGSNTVHCDAKCAHAVPHEVHEAGCPCPDCYLDTTHISVGCLENDLCEKINNFTRCVEVPVKVDTITNVTYGNLNSRQG
jgi:hypothetical protein